MYNYIVLFFALSHKNCADYQPQDTKTVHADYQPQGIKMQICLFCHAYSNCMMPCFQWLLFPCMMFFFLDIVAMNVKKTGLDD